MLSLAVYSRREHSTCMSQVILQDSIQSRSCLNPSSNRRRRKRKEKKREGRNTVVAGSCLIPTLLPQLPFLRSTFSTVPRRFSPFPGIILFFSSFFFYTLLATTRLSLSPSFVIDYGPFETCCRLTGRKEEYDSTIRISWSY